MADRLIMHFDGEQATWLGASGALFRGTPAQAADAASERDVVVLLPSEEILLTHVRLPPIRQARRRLQAARYALEDQLVARVDSLHFALAARPDADGETPVAVVDRQRLRDMLEALTEAGLRIVLMIADVLALPVPPPGDWQAALIDDRMLVRTRPGHGFASETALWPVLAAGCTPPPDTVRLWADSAAEATLVPPLDFDAAPAIEPDIVDDDSTLARLLLHVDTTSAINLRQGEFARASVMQTWWQPFKLTAGLAAFWLFTAIAARGIESWQLHQRIDRLHATSEATFRGAFPQVKTINDLRVQAEQNIRALRGQGGSGGVFPLLQATAEVTGKAGDIRIQSLQYRNGTLYLSLRGANVQALESLRAGFARQTGTALTVESADAAANGVQISASVSRTGAS